MSGETTQKMRENHVETTQKMREIIESFLRFMPKVLRSPWFVEANGDDVNEGLVICARAESMLCENGGAL